MAEVRTQWRRGYLGEILRSQDVGEDIQRRCRRVLAAARSSAPVDTGDFVGSLDMTVGVERGRVKGRVFSTDPAGRVIEARHSTLEQALGAARG